ncbi:unnamed protein product [Onchocerca flexuosa]|uniref:Uncharacterized protein n=1 Tax=Onchocerca flexuosa TaxID=387005 RepID=A0A183H1W1_9BILA|nr:unnamed protein product [Onchocerca flexuosa]
MVLRPSIEKWSRQELEDRYHIIYQQYHSLKRSYDDLETKLKQSNARLKRMVGNGKDCDNDAELIKENRLLTNKLKNLKQQILNYSRPGTSTQYLSSPQVRLPLQRPKTAFSRKPHPIQRTISPPSQSVNIQQKSTIDVSKASDSKSLLTDKTLFVKLNRELQEKDNECALLSSKFNNVKQQLEKLKDEYDQLLEQFQSKKQEDFKSQQQLNELPLSADITNAKRSKNIQIMEEELKITRQENKMLREANEKLVEKFVFDAC